MTEWSKVLRSGRSVFARVGSNPTVCIFPFSIHSHLFHLICYVWNEHAWRVQWNVLCSLFLLIRLCWKRNTRDTCADRSNYPEKQRRKRLRVLADLPFDSGSQSKGRSDVYTLHSIFSTLFSWLVLIYVCKNRRALQESCFQGTSESPSWCWTSSLTYLSASSIPFSLSLKALSLPMLPYGLPTESYSICDHAIIAVDSTDSSEGNSFHLVFLDESRVDYHLPCWWGVCLSLRVFWRCLGDGIILVRLLWYVSFAKREGTGTIPLVYAFSES